MKNTDFEIVQPSAAAMIESMRAYGYSLAVAIADLIDNSITAGAKNVWLHFHWSGSDSWISVADDGTGMSEERLVAAMRLGSQSPLDEREEGDLGRFGLGLKTASFSQCRRLTVRTLQNNSEAIRCWDLDFIAESAENGNDEWLLLKSCHRSSEPRLEFPVDIRPGTIVVWEEMDRVVSDAPVSNQDAHNAFLRNIKEVESYLAMVFHRFLEGGRRKLNIFINGTDSCNKVKPWDPFLDSHPCTWSTPMEPIRVNRKRFMVRGFVLPHKDKIGSDLHQTAAGPNGWNAQQGFYVYRNLRLIVAGSWLGLGHNKPWTQEEHYKLARIQIDIPNSMDALWQIDVKKSVAAPPQKAASRLTEIAKEVRKKAREVYAHRGKHGPKPKKKNISKLWIAKTKDGRPVYKIDRNHPLVKKIKTTTGKSSDEFEALLTVIEQTVPVQRIWLDTAEKPDSHPMPFEQITKKEILRIIRISYEALINDGRLHDEAIAYLLLQEEFSEYGDLINSIKSEEQ